jgi:transposase
VEATPAAFGAVQIVWADQGYTGAFAEWLHETRGTRPEVVRHPARQACRHGLEDRPKHAFEVLPRRWVVERTFARRLPCIAGRPARLGQSRRFSKDYERLPATSEAVIYGAGGAASCSGASRASDPAWRGHVAAAPGALS